MAKTKRPKGAKKRLLAKFLGKKPEPIKLRNASARRRRQLLNREHMLGNMSKAQLVGLGIAGLMSGGTASLPLLAAGGVAAGTAAGKAIYSKIIRS